MMLKSDGRILVLCQDEIDWLEADGNYVRVHLRNGSHLIRAQMSELEEKLNPNDFMRLNRSAIVNFDFIEEMKPWFRGTYRAILRDGTELILSRSYRERLFSMLPKPLGMRSIAR
jgi:two-component system LytT family response regulator